MGERHCRELFSSNAGWPTGPYCTIRLSSEQDRHLCPHNSDYDLFWDETINVRGTEGQAFIAAVQKLRPLRGYEETRLVSPRMVLMRHELIKKIECGGFLCQEENKFRDPIPLDRFIELANSFDRARISA